MIVILLVIAVTASAFGAGFYAGRISMIDEMESMDEMDPMEEDTDAL